MVNKIINGDFSGGTNGSPDLDPNGWEVIGETDQHQVVADHELPEYQGWAAFNTNNSPSGSQIRQTVNDIKIGDEVAFSFDFKEVGGRPEQTVMITYLIFDSDGNEVLRGNASSTDNSFETPVQTITQSFIAESSSYTIVLFDSSSVANNPKARDILIDNVVFDVPCFCRGTLIKTLNGTVAIEDIKVGDLVLTRDHEFQPVRWVGSTHLSKSNLETTPKLKPVRIRAGSLGQNSPEVDLLVSPQHRVLVRSKIAQRMFGTPEILVAAKHLCEIDGIEISEDAADVCYHHLMFDQHEVIFSNGAETESLYAGEQALKSIGLAAREEIFALFPELKHSSANEDPASARPLARGRLARHLASRHRQNNRQLVN